MGAAEVPLGQFDAFIFDMDGVVTKTATVHAAAWKRVFDEFLAGYARRHGTSFEPFDPDGEYRRYVDGKPRYDGIRSFLAARGIELPVGEPGSGGETIRALGDRKNGYFLDELRTNGAEIFPSTVALIEELKRHGCKAGVFSASRNCREVLEAAGVAELFDARVDGVVAEEMGLKGKPDAAMLLELTRRLRSEPRRTVVVEDAIAGVEAGRSGGFGLVIGVNRSLDRGSLLGRGADIEVADLAEVTLVAAGELEGGRHG